MVSDFYRFETRKIYVKKKVDHMIASDFID